MCCQTHHTALLNVLQSRGSSPLGSNEIEASEHEKSQLNRRSWVHLTTSSLIRLVFSSWALEGQECELNMFTEKRLWLMFCNYQWSTKNRPTPLDNSIIGIHQADAVRVSKKASPSAISWPSCSDQDLYCYFCDGNIPHHGHSADRQSFQRHAKFLVITPEKRFSSLDTGRSLHIFLYYAIPVNKFQLWQTVDDGYKWWASSKHSVLLLMELIPAPDTPILARSTPLIARAALWDLQHEPLLFP